MRRILLSLIAAAAAVGASAQVDYNRQGPLSDKSFNIVLLGDPQN